MPTERIFHAFTDLPEHRGDIIITSQCRFAELRRRRILGNVIVESFSSGFVLEDLVIDGGSLRVQGGCFQGRLSGIFVDGSTASPAAIHIGDGAGTVCTTLTLERLNARWAKHWGLHITNQVSLTAIGLAADDCGKAGGAGGILAVSAHGSYSGLNLESNDIGVRFYDCYASVTGPNWKDNKTPVLIQGGKVDIRP